MGSNIHHPYTYIHTHMYHVLTIYPPRLARIIEILKNTNQQHIQGHKRIAQQAFPFSPFPTPEAAAAAASISAIISFAFFCFFVNGSSHFVPSNPIQFHYYVGQRYVRLASRSSFTLLAPIMASLSTGLAFLRAVIFSAMAVTFARSSSRLAVAVVATISGLASVVMATSYKWP